MILEYYKAHFNTEKEKLSYNPMKMISNEGEISHHQIVQCKQMQRSKFISIDLGDIDFTRIHPLETLDPEETRRRFIRFAKEKHVLIDFCIPAHVNDLK